MKYEYLMVFRSDWDSYHKPINVMAAVNKLMSEGWEIILIEPYGMNAMYHFKRAIR